MEIYINQEAIAAAVAAEVGKVLGPAVDRAVQAYLARHVSPGMGIVTDRDEIERLAAYVRNAKLFSDRRWNSILSRGLMPHSKLMGLSRLQREDFERLVKDAINADQIKVVRMPGYKGVLYAPVI